MHARSVSWAGKARAAGRQPVRLVVATDQPRASAGVSGEREERRAGAGSSAVSVSLLRWNGRNQSCYGSDMSDTQYGIGAYTLTEAGRLLDVSPATLKRWLFGYSYRHHGPITKQPPLWGSQYGTDEDEPLVGFRDLIEARVVRGLRSLGIGLPTIRQCLLRASELVDDTHPFSTRRFKSDGQKIFLEITDRLAGSEQEPALIDLKSRQRVFRTIVAPSFVDLSFDAEVASRWWLLPNKRTIVLDPERSFGQPIVAENGVPTARLAQAVTAEGSVERVARLFELKPQIVRDALRFEDRKVGKLAA